MDDLGVFRAPHPGDGHLREVKLDKIQPSQSLSVVFLMFKTNFFR